MSFSDQSAGLVNRPPPSNLRPNLPRSFSTPSWTKNASMESLALSGAFQTPNSPSTTQSLRKRHSTHVLSSYSDQSPTPLPVPSSPPKRPLRNPARATAASSPDPPKLRVKTRRPSTATGVSELAASWEAASGPITGESSTSLTSESSSLVSAIQQRVVPTGPVSEVTPWELYPVRRSATSRSSLTKGLIEEVTPWELYPVPTVMPSRSTLATGPVEEVTPWELVPAPMSTDTTASASEKPSARRSTSSGPSKSLSEIAYLRRRKSTTNKTPKLRSDASSTIQPLSSVIRPSAAENEVVDGVPSTALNNQRTSPRQLTLATSGLPSSRPQPSTPSAFPKDISSQAIPRFSTADRTILEELKRNIKARESQFVLKGEGSPILGFRGKRHHPFPPTEVPYPRNYEREVMDLDVWETAFCQDTCGSLTWHVFETPPIRVLDLGCGTGTWVLNCARAWKNSHFVGLDIVPLQPDLQQIGSSDLAARITWIHHNFLDGLPFPNDEFDFVHIKRIALGVPEDKWELLLEEICRVMKPGAAFEMLEEDLFFPGRLIDSDSDRDSESDGIPKRRSQELSTPSYSDATLESDSRVSVPHLSDDALSSTPTTEVTPKTPSRTHSPVADVATNEENAEEAHDLLAHVIGSYPNPSRDTTVNGFGVQLDAAVSVASGPQLRVKIPQTRSTMSPVSHLTSSIGSAGSTDDVPDTPSITQTRPRHRGYSFTASTYLSQSDLSSSQNKNTKEFPAREEPSSSVPLLLKTVPKAPLNPRDHTLLETIYIRLLESRFINASPLALLTNAIGLYFKDIRTHPPLQYHFPAVSLSNPSSDPKDDELSRSEDASSDSDDARDAILPSPTRIIKGTETHRVSSQNYEQDSAPVISEDNRYVNVRGLIQHSSPYITLDESRASALSPSIKGMFPGISSAQLQRGSFLPNTTMNFDLNTLNLHLALRIVEILACSESMWEWVLGYQAESKARQTMQSAVRSHRSGSGSIEILPRKSITSISSRDSNNPIENSILDLTRADFDWLLSNFEMDMREKSALGNALQDRFFWNLPDSGTSPERKVFQSACEKWNKWEKEQLANSKSPSTDSPRSIHQTQKPGVYASSHQNTNYDRQPSSQDRKDKKRISASAGTPTPRLSRAMRVFVAWKTD